MANPPDDSPLANRPPEGVVALAGALRDLTETMLRVAALPADLERAAHELAERSRALEARLAPHARDDRLPRMGAEPEPQRPYYVRGPVIGAHHPAQPLFAFSHEPGRSFGRITFGVSHEGPPGAVHGGVVAFFFDEVLGQHNVWSQIPAMTGTLTVRYRAATPILTELSFEVRSRREGERKVVTRGALEADGTVYAEAEGTFVIPRDARWSGELA